MLVILPPSETKRDGGHDGTTLSLDELSFPELTRARRAALAGLRRTSSSVSRAMAALRLGPTQRAEVERNRQVTSSPLMPAIDRYTGVLYDALDSATLPEAARAWLFQHVVIHSALFGLTRAGDEIPAYRLSHDSRLDGVALRALWREPIGRVLAGEGGVILDLRSEGYVELGPAPARAHSVFTRVLTVDDSGARRALNHFNKTAKGELVRALAVAGRNFGTVEELVEWAAESGIELARGPEGEVHLVV
ncbi:YaaA family protein [Galbitalea soli]|uniref:Peroxide stress protein YaaA n=1 Tax=Galbitalea soli TaxID=1268042 RepID=A0A7C9PLR6_9MICO|nr:peroxide stress protein YaaA [Galbitalea soli]NEM90454.1 peroxide stress protein YaaA [Galbitalea soli]NYJ31166.1 hypothetical protein [Galbitalea soli]